MNAVNLDQFLQAYAVCALWSSCGPDQEPHKCENLDDLFDTDDINPDTWAQMKADCEDFIQANSSYLELYAERRGNEQWSASELAGHDFWLTRNGHGAGFWDRGLGALGDRLSEAAKVYGEVFLYPGDDGKIHC